MFSSSMQRALIPKEDHELVKDYLAGNEEAFAELLHRHQSRIFTTIVLIVRDETQAEDLFQEAMIKVIRLIQDGKYDEKGKFAPWVVKIARNLAIDQYRKEKRGPQWMREQEGIDVYSLTGHTQESIEQQLIREEDCQYVQGLIDQIPEKQREVLVMRHYGGLSFKEIAKLQGVNINTALGRMRYALLNMRRFAGLDTTVSQDHESQIHE